MAILPINFYNDWLCTQAGQAIVPGVAAATGWAADPAHWNRYTYYATHGDILFITGKMLAQNSGDLILSGGAAIYDNNISDMIPYGDNIDTDRISESPSSANWPNGFFIGRDDTYAFSLSISSNSATGNSYNIRMGYYTQQPEEATGTARTNWNYLSTYFDLQWNSICTPWNSSSGYFTSSQQQTKAFKLFLGNDAYFLFAFGVSADGTYSSGGVTSNGSCFLAIPLAYFKDKEARPWVGEESEPDEDTGFMPNTEASDNITARSDFGTNPYSINSGGSGIKVIFPEYVEGSYYQLMGDIISGIYQGSNEGFINRVEQVWAELVNGNTNRAAEEIQAILNGILFYHTIPVIETYSSAYHSFRTICGYNIINEGKYVAKASASIFSRTFYSDVINPRLNCFLDYEPYTSMVIKVPFCPAVSVSPSAVYGKAIKAVYKIDIVTGILHCDVSIYSASHEYIIHSCEANVKTDIPIMGQGANAGGLEKITGAVLGAMSGNVGAGASGIIGTLDAVAGKSHGEAVGMMSTDGIGAYLAARSAYLIVTYPKAAIPTQEEDGAPVGGFLWQQGMASATAQKVSYYAGGFAKFSSVDLSRVQATQAEKEDIEARLKEGVYL